jgi:hypothetical protein
MRILPSRDQVRWLDWPVVYAIVAYDAARIVQARLRAGLDFEPEPYALEKPHGRMHLRDWMRLR